MKKLISVLLCLALLFSFGAFASAEETPQLKITTSKVLADDQEEHYCFSLAVKNCTHFESLELLITYNSEVLEYSKVFPYAMTDEYKHPISCTVEADDRLRVTVYNSDPLMFGNIEKIEPFCFNFIGTGFTGVSVDLVSFRTTDGEVENINFVADIQNFTVTEVYVKYDLDGNGVVTSEDARQALRFAVGLDIPTDAQCRAAGVYDADSFTSDLARFLLRAAVGLEGEVEKVVVQTEWVTDGENAFLVYHYSDGTYGTVGSPDSRPDWV